MRYSVGLGGILAGHMLTKSWHDLQWHRDKRYQDYQDVLTSVTTAYMAILRLNKIEGTLLHTSESAMEVEIIKIESFRTIRDRIFIAKELEHSNIFKDWESAVTQFNEDSDEELFAIRFNIVNRSLVSMALNPPKRLWGLGPWRHQRARMSWLGRIWK